MTEGTVFHAGLVLKVEMRGWPSEFMQKFDRVKSCATDMFSSPFSTCP